MSAGAAIARAGSARSEARCMVMSLTLERAVGLLGYIFEAEKWELWFFNDRIRTSTPFYTTAHLVYGTQIESSSHERIPRDPNAAMLVEARY